MINYSEHLFYLDIAKVNDIKFLYDLMPDVYIRKEISDDNVYAKKRALIVESDEKTATIQVQEPLSFYKDDNSQIYVVSGNTRIKALQDYYNNAKKTGKGSKTKYNVKVIDSSKTSEKYVEKEVTFLPIPYRWLESKPAEEDLIKIQLTTNDSTAKHTQLELAHSVNNYWNKHYSIYVDEGVSHGDAKKRATVKTQATYGYSGAYLSQLKSILDMPEYIRELVDNGDMSVDTAVTLRQKSKKFKIDISQGLSLGKAQLKPGENKIGKSHIVKAFELYENTIKSSKEQNESKEDTNNTEAVYHDNIDPSQVIQNSSLSRESEKEDDVSLPETQHINALFVDMIDALQEIKINNANAMKGTLLMEHLLRIMLKYNYDINTLYTPEAFESIATAFIKRFSPIRDNNNFANTLIGNTKDKLPKDLGKLQKLIKETEMAITEMIVEENELDAATLEDITVVSETEHENVEMLIV